MTPDFGNLTMLVDMFKRISQSCARGFVLENRRTSERKKRNMKRYGTGSEEVNITDESAHQGPRTAQESILQMKEH